MSFAFQDFTEICNILQLCVSYVLVVAGNALILLLLCVENVLKALLSLIETLTSVSFCFRLHLDVTQTFCILCIWEMQQSEK